MKLKKVTREVAQSQTIHCSENFQRISFAYSKQCVNSRVSRRTRKLTPLVKVPLCL